MKTINYEEKTGALQSSKINLSSTKSNDPLSARIQTSTKNKELGLLGLNAPQTVRGSVHIGKLFDSTFSDSARLKIPKIKFGQVDRQLTQTHSKYSSIDTFQQKSQTAEPKKRRNIRTINTHDFSMNKVHKSLMQERVLYDPKVMVGSIDNQNTQLGKIMRFGKNQIMDIKNNKLRSNLKPNELLLKYQKNLMPFYNQEKMKTVTEQ